MPCASESNFASSGQRDQRVKTALIVASGELAGDGRNLVLGEFDPLRAGGAVVIPVQSRMRC